MQLQPLVTIIIPAYNAAATTARALDSALAHTYGQIEAIVIDNGGKLAVESSAKMPLAIGMVPYTDNSDTWLALASSGLGTIVVWMTCLASWVNSPTASMMNCAT